MYSLDREYLATVGLGELPEAESAELLRRIYDELQLRVGMQIAQTLNEDQLDEFDVLLKATDQGAALSWLERNAPEYQVVVAAQLEEVTDELRAAAPMILSEIAARP